MTDLLAFLNARLDDDERVAREAVIRAHNGHRPHPELSEWHYGGDEVEYVSTPEMRAHPYFDPYYVTMDNEGLLPAVDEKVGPHIARHDPARVLREVAAKRAIIESYTGCRALLGTLGSPRSEGYVDGLGKAIEALASVYADHPDFDPAWALTEEAK